MIYKYVVFSVALTSVVGGACAGDGAAAEEGTFTNPVIAADWPDPAFWNGGDGWYYSVATGLKTIRRSRNLVDWEDAHIDPLTPRARERLHQVSRNVWAPCVMRLGGKWVLYISLFVSDPDCRIAALTSDAPTGPFEFAGEVIDSRREGVWNAIDPYVLAVDGHVWMFFGSLADGIHRVELSADGLSVKPGAKPVHVAGVRRPADKMKHAWEGSYLHFRKGWWYLFVSGGHYGDHTYYLTVGRSRRIDGEFQDSKGRPMTDGLAEPILSSGEGDFFYGPGHNGEIFTSADGRDYIFYHAHARSFKPSERPTLLQELLWSEDGWPRFKDDRPQKTVREPMPLPGKTSACPPSQPGAVIATSRSTPVTAYDFREYNPFRFSAEYADNALGLIYYNYRHYNWMSGRWTNRDVIDINSLNLAIFCENAPIECTDYIGGVSSINKWSIPLKVVKIIAKKNFGEVEKTIETALDLYDDTRYDMISRGIRKCMEGKEDGSCDACCIITGRVIAGDPPKYMLISGETSCGSCNQYVNKEYLNGSGVFMEFVQTKVKQCE
jgi:arabinan endo-1,5-alpha-L-arabinosidase